MAAPKLSGQRFHVKNRAPAPIQITAEQLLRDAQSFRDYRTNDEVKRQIITDEHELGEYRSRKRAEFENALRKSKYNITVWLKYAKWEASQNDLDRARSVFERALDIDYRNASLWTAYATIEMKNKFVNHARNVWDRAVTMLPRVDHLWYKFVYMEEMLQNVSGVRQIFERWMDFHPDERAWLSYIKFEIRNKQIDRARVLYERFTIDHNKLDSYLKWAKFEQRFGSPELQRNVYERALIELADGSIDPRLLVAFAEFEVHSKEFDRARAIFKHALDSMTKTQAKELYKRYSKFEKQYGTIESIEDVVLAKRRFHYEDEATINPFNYDVWFDYARLEQTRHDIERTRNVFERAVAQIPPVAEKKYWKRYIYVWILYALFEENEAQSIDRARQVHQRVLEVVPHKKFTFTKLWMNAAEFETRHGDVSAARRILGRGLGTCPHDKLFKCYIEFEMQTGDVDRVRALFGRQLETNPANYNAWIAYASFESSLQEIERARAVYELAISQPQLDAPETVWRQYIDFEISNQNYDGVENLYTQLLEKTKHPKVWVARAEFHASIGKLPLAREGLAEADRYFNEIGKKDERAFLLQQWLELEKRYGDAKTLADVESKQPQQVRRKRPLVAPDGSEYGVDEYVDYIFPAEIDATSAGSLKILQAAKAWKRQQLEKKNAAPS